MSSITTPEEAHALRQEVQSMIRDRLPEFSAELLAWDSTAILPDGVVRAAGAKFDALPGHSHSLGLVRSMVEAEAYRQAIATVAERLTRAQARLIVSVGQEIEAGSRVECERDEFRPAKALGRLGLLREVPERLEDGQMHFDVVVTVLGETVSRILAANT